MRKSRLAVLFAMLFVLAGMGGITSPAQATTWYYYSHNSQGGCTTFYTTPCWVYYTGGYPNGIVKAVGGLNAYEIMLQTKTSAGGAWSTVATDYPGTTRSASTPTVKVGKFNYYTACIKTIKGGPTWCISDGPIYLGD